MFGVNNKCKNNKLTEYFERIDYQFKSNTNAIKTYYHAIVFAVKVSYLIAYKITKNIKQHNIGENLILLASIDMLGKEATNKFKLIPA